MKTAFMHIIRLAAVAGLSYQTPLVIKHDKRGWFAKLFGIGQVPKSELFQWVFHDRLHAFETSFHQSILDSPLDGMQLFIKLNQALAVNPHDDNTNNTTSSTTTTTTSTVSATVTTPVPKDVTTNSDITTKATTTINQIPMNRNINNNTMSSPASTTTTTTITTDNNNNNNLTPDQQSTTNIPTTKLEPKPWIDWSSSGDETNDPTQDNIDYDNLDPKEIMRLDQEAQAFFSNAA